MARGRGVWLFAGAGIGVCAVLVGPSVPDGGPFAASSPTVAARKAVANRVMTWNLCNPCGENEVDQAAEIAAYAPQVVGLQEACERDVETIRGYLKSRHGLVYHVEYGAVLHNWRRCGGAPWNPGGYGQAILSAAPMTDIVKEEYADGGSEDRGYMAVTTRVGDRPVRVFNTHLAQRRQEAVRAEQAAMLAEEVARHDRAVVLGDFNAVPDTAELTPLWKLASDADPGCGPSRAGDCEPTTDWQSKFDYVFLRDIAPLRRHIVPTPYSDHHILYADLNMASRGR
ncbi:endonuclease/exonuclease/phosphatase family protein [Streptomyces sp. NPDC002553]|uniref:endonuclease/exonuclease/phosphatase family protein n=1 Tax=Streptomyces sp. NPDC002553 TaxID=3154417 RepID=UPI00331E4E11